MALRSLSQLLNLCHCGEKVTRDVRWTNGITVFQKTFFTKQAVDQSLHVGNNLLTAVIGPPRPLESSWGFILNVIRIIGGL